MSHRIRHLSLPVLALLGTALVGASIAWACTPSAGFTTSQSSGPPGAAVALQGHDFVPSQPVEIRFGTTQVATGTPDAGGNFATSFSVPRNAPGDVYTIVAISKDPSDGQVYKARGAFEVTTRPAPNSNNSGTTSGGEPEAGGGDGRSQSTSGAEPEADGGGSRSQTTSGAERGSVDTGSGRTTGDTPAAQPQTKPSRGSIESAPENGATARGGSDAGSDSGVFSGSEPRGEGRSDAGASTAAGASERSAAGDLWGGFGSDEKAASLTTGADSPAKADSGAGRLIGAGLLGFGLLTLVGGFGLAEVRRRRALAG